jgi:hypothetical protein
MALHFHYRPVRLKDRVVPHRSVFDGIHLPFWHVKNCTESIISRSTVNPGLVNHLRHLMEIRLAWPLGSQ